MGLTRQKKEELLNATVSGNVTSSVFLHVGADCFYVHIDVSSGAAFDCAATLQVSMDGTTYADNGTLALGADGGYGFNVPAPGWQRARVDFVHTAGSADVVCKGESWERE